MAGFEGTDRQCPHEFSAGYQREIEQYLKSLPGQCGDERGFCGVTDNGVPVEQDFFMFAQGTPQRGGMQGFSGGIVLQTAIVRSKGE